MGIFGLAPRAGAAAYFLAALTGPRDAGSQTAHAGAQEQAAEGAEDIAQVDGRGAHQIGGDGDAHGGADGGQRSQKAGHGDALGGNFLIHGKNIKNSLNNKN